MSGSIRIVDMPDLGTVTDASSVVGERAGSGRFGMPAVKTYLGTTFATQSDLATETAARVANQLGISVKTHGAIGDGVANDTAAFNAATAEAHAAGSGIVLVPVGAYLIDPISIPDRVTLTGIIVGPIEPNNPATSIVYPTLLVNSTAAPFITLNTSSSLQDLLIHYPQQVAPSATTPNIYPAAVHMSAPSQVRRCTITNAYVGIEVRIGRTIIQDCKIGAFSVGIDVDLDADYTFIDKIFIQPFWDIILGLAVGQPIDAWVLNNGIGIKVGRADAATISNVGVLYRSYGVQLVDGAAGSPRNSYGHMSDIDLDTVRYGVQANSTNNSAYGWQITNMNVGSCDYVGTPGQAAIQLQSGGVSAPTVTWIGGSVRGTWAAGGGFQIAAGLLNIENVRGMTGLGHVTQPAVPASGASVTSPFPYRCGVYPVGFNQISIAGTQTGASMPAYFEVQPGQAVGVTYSGTPSWVWFSL
jgi:hypothetical protein